MLLNVIARGGLYVNAPKRRHPADAAESDRDQHHQRDRQDYRDDCARVAQALRQRRWRGGRLLHARVIDDLLFGAAVWLGHRLDVGVAFRGLPRQRWTILATGVTARA